MERKGRLNLTQFLENGTVKKIALVKEKNRPHRLKREKWALELAKSRGLNVPGVLDYFLDSDGNEVLILEKIDGVTLDRQDSKIREMAMRLAGQQMLKLADACKKYGWIDPYKLTGTYNTWKLFLISFAQVYGQRLVETKLLNLNKLKKIIKRINELDFNFSSPFLIHRDIKLENIIYSAKEDVWIIDWENAILGDPIFELAVFSARNGRNGLWKNLLVGYGFEISKNNCLLYEMYETLALIGLISFLYKNNINYEDKVSRLNAMV